MMRLLLDTHAWLWALNGSDRLSSAGRAAIASADDVALSVASVWEVGLKHAAGKLRLASGVRPLVDEAITALGVRILPLLADHVLEGAALPSHHKDPFDRVLIAQARAEALTLVTADDALRAYDVEILWIGS